MRSLFLALLVGPAWAQEFVEVPGPLPDDAFYRAVACAAEPGGDCRKPFIRWPTEKRRALAVSLASVPPGVPDYKRRLFEAALEGALAELNRLDAGIALRRTDGPGDIDIHVVATPPGHVMAGTGIPALEGAVLPLARVALRARDGEILSGIIAISAFARRREIASVFLEEITQALGLMTDVRGAAYRRSLFSEDGNSVTRIEGQDADAIRRHYAARGEGDE
ncbi:MAG: DUF2927 domain-containing protein [Pseudomonadota bacterium]